MSGLSLASGEVAAIVETVTRDVFSTMMGAEIVAGEVREVPRNNPLADRVVALVGIGGEWTGSGRLDCSPQAACFFASRFLQTEYAEVDPQVLDVMAEIANMIIGNLKNALEKDLGPLSVSIPTVIYGECYQTHIAARSWTVLPVQCGDEVLEVSYFLAPSPGRMPDAL